MTDSPELKTLRERIDALDGEIQSLISQRATCAEQVARVKLAEFERARQAGENPGEVLFYRPEREAQVLQRIVARNGGPLGDDAMAHIFREIMSACLALEKPLTVAYFGPRGTFTEAAALKHFGHAAVAEPQSTIGAVFAQVESGECNYGVVPVENSTEGMVSHTLDNFIDSPLTICGEVELRIQLHLLAAPGATMSDIKRICGHQQALAQCRNWLDHHDAGIERVAVASNGEGARLASVEPATAAVAGEMAAELYGLERLATNIEDRADNTTRFLVIGRNAVPPSGRDKTSIVVSTRNKPGALFRLLQPFERENISLTRIDTRPSRTETWTYVFFIEFEGHLADAPIKRVMAEIEEHSVLLKPLGSYPRAAY